MSLLWVNASADDLPHGSYWNEDEGDYVHTHYSPPGQPNWWGPKSYEVTQRRCKALGGCPPYTQKRHWQERLHEHKMSTDPVYRQQKEQESAASGAAFTKGLTDRLTDGMDEFSKRKWVKEHVKGWGE